MTEFLVLPGHHLYRMDYQHLIKAHRNSKAEITVAASSASITHDPGFGILELDSQSQVSAFRFNSKEGKWINFASPVSCIYCKEKTNFCSSYSVLEDI